MTATIEVRAVIVQRFTRYTNLYDAVADVLSKHHDTVEITARYTDNEQETAA